MSEVKIFVSVRDRFAETWNCVRSLIQTTRGRADLYLFDNGSDHHLVTLVRAYEEWMKAGDLAQVVMNRTSGMPGVYWSKNFAWAQFLLMMSLLPPQERRWLVMADNDVVAEPGWLASSLEALEAPESAERGVAVITPYDGPPNVRSNPQMYHALGQYQAGSHAVEMRDKTTSRLWVAAYDFWTRWPPPTHCVVNRDGKQDRVPTDWYYWQGMKEAGLRFGHLIPPLAHDPAGSWPSARLDNGIGADVRRRSS